MRAVDGVGYRVWNRNCAAPVDLGSLRSLALVHPSGLGDMLLTLPLLHTLRSTWAGEVTIVCDLPVAAWLGATSWVGRVVAADFALLRQSLFRPHLAGLARLWKPLHALTSDLIYELRGDLRLSLLLFAAASRRRLGGFTFGGGGFWFERAFDGDFVHTHISEIYRTILYDLGIATDPLVGWRASLVPVEACSDLELPTAYLTVHIGCGLPARRWPTANFLALIRQLSLRMPVVVLGSSSDLAAGDASCFDLPGVVNLIGRLSFGQCLAVISRSRLHIGLDTAATHGAALLGRPFLALYSGAEYHRRSTPFFLYPNQGVVIQNRPECSGPDGCARKLCRPNVCMTAISTEQVLHRAQEQLARPVGSSGAAHGILSGTPWTGAGTGAGGCVGGH